MSGARGAGIMHSCGGWRACDGTRLVSTGGAGPTTRSIRDLSGGQKAAGPWPRLRSKRILALVFLSPKRRISRELACEALFGDLAPRSASSALYNALSSARGVLAALGQPATAVLGTDRADIYISPTAAIEVDLNLHEQAIAAALQMTPGAGRDEALAIALSEERALLEDELYADWSVRRRDRLELSRQAARVALARDRSTGYGASGPESVMEAWEAVFSHDPASEEAATALMGAYASQGQRQSAVRTYDRCRAGLEDLGLEPSPALERAYPQCETWRWPVWGRRSLLKRHAFSATYPPPPAASSAERSSRPRSVRWFGHRPS